MTFEIEVNRLAAKMAVGGAALAMCALLGLAAVTNFIVGVLTDERVTVSREMLAAATGYAPNSALLHARLAEAEMTAEQRDLSSIEAHAERAANISPWDYTNQTLLATAREARGDRAGAEQALRAALALAPNYTDVRWRLANVLLREGKLAESLKEFRKAVSKDASLLPQTLDLTWRAAGGNLEAVRFVAGGDVKARLQLAQFLLKQSRTAEAASVFNGIDPAARLGSTESSTFISALIGGGNPELARSLWVGLLTAGDSAAASQAGGSSPLVWNGGFESDILKDFAQFDWAISPADSARLTLDGGAARTGGRALRIDFLGRDTTRLDGNVKQLIVVRPGARYRLECYVKAEGLVTPEGPRLAVMDNKSSAVIASSDAAGAGSYDWQRLAVEFVAPANSRSVLITIRRIPKFSYDDPTRGVVWFDDFTLAEQGQSK